MRRLLLSILFLISAPAFAVGPNDPVEPIDLTDIFVSESFIVKRASSGVDNLDVAGVGITVGSGADYSAVSGDLGVALTKLLAGKMSLSFVPKQFIDFIHVNPDVIIKSLPFAHYFSYIFDITSQLEIKSGNPLDKNIAPFKVHLGNPATNENVKRVENLMLVRFQKSAEEGGDDRAGFYYLLPDGTLIKSSLFGLSEVLFHISSTYWLPVIERLKKWWKGRMEEIVEGNTDKIESAILKMEGDPTHEQLMEYFESEEGTNIFWEIFREFKTGVDRSGKDIKELLEILRDISFSETVIDGLSRDGVKSAGMLYKIGQVLPYPNLEMFLQLLKDIISKIKGIPKLKLGWPKNDIRMAIVTKYINERVVEVNRIIVAPSAPANDWYPVFLNPDWHREVETIDGERLDGQLRPLSHYGKLMVVPAQTR